MIVYDFMSMLKDRCAEDEALLFCGFSGDPNENATWKMSRYSDSTRFISNMNLYVCVMSSKRNERNEFRRKKENFGHGLFLMIDDLGDGLGAKNPMAIIDKLKPTLLVETSPGNHQAFYVFREPVAELELFEALINAFIAKNFLDGRDPGMRGVNRVARVPFGINGKAKYGGWNVKPVSWEPDLLYTPDDLIKAFDLVLTKRKPWDGTRLVAEDAENRIEVWEQVYDWLKKHNMLKKLDADLGGKIPMTCPWVDHHSDGADSGTYLALPSEENGYCGSFVCYHSSTHNDKTGWGMLLGWVLQQERTQPIKQLLEKGEQDIMEALERANNAG